MIYNFTSAVAVGNQAGADRNNKPPVWVGGWGVIMQRCRQQGVNRQKKSLNGHISLFPYSAPSLGHVIDYLLCPSFQFSFLLHLKHAQFKCTESYRSFSDTHHPPNTLNFAHGASERFVFCHVWIF